MRAAVYSLDGKMLKPPDYQLGVFERRLMRQIVSNDFQWPNRLRANIKRGLDWKYGEIYQAFCDQAPLIWRLFREVVEDPEGVRDWVRHKLAAPTPRFDKQTYQRLIEEFRELTSVEFIELLEGKMADFYYYHLELREMVIDYVVLTRSVEKVYALAVAMEWHARNLLECPDLMRVECAKWSGDPVRV